jgi:hypothetical protein
MLGTGMYGTKQYARPATPGQASHGLLVVAARRLVRTQHGAARRGLSRPWSRPDPGFGEPAGLGIESRHLVVVVVSPATENARVVERTRVRAAPGGLNHGAERGHRGMPPGVLSPARPTRELQPRAIRSGRMGLAAGSYSARSAPSLTAVALAACFSRYASMKLSRSPSSTPATSPTSCSVRRSFTSW